MVIDHYRTLGVPAGATAGELRAAYLMLARQNHPDRFDGDKRLAAEERMQAINEAWNVVGTAHRRRDYDRRHPPDQQTGPADSADKRGHSNFRPFDESTLGSVDVDLDPTPLAGSRQIPRWVSLMPIALLVGAAAFMGFGLLVNAASIIALSLAIFALGVVGFLMVPLLVMSRAERDPSL